MKAVYEKYMLLKGGRSTMVAKKMHHFEEEKNSKIIHYNNI